MVLRTHRLVFAFYSDQLSTEQSADVIKGHRGSYDPSEYKVDPWVKWDMSDGVLADRKWTTATGLVISQSVNRGEEATQSNYKTMLVAYLLSRPKILALSR